MTNFSSGFKCGKKFAQKTIGFFSGIVGGAIGLVAGVMSIPYFMLVDEPETQRDRDD